MIWGWTYTLVMKLWWMEKFDAINSLSILDYPITTVTLGLPFATLTLWNISVSHSYWGKNVVSHETVSKYYLWPLSKLARAISFPFFFWTTYMRSELRILSQTIKNKLTIGYASWQITNPSKYLFLWFLHLW